MDQNLLEHASESDNEKIAFPKLASAFKSISIC
jgi:hypothetical protein